MSEQTKLAELQHRVAAIYCGKLTLEFSAGMAEWRVRIHSCCWEADFQWGYDEEVDDLEEAARLALVAFDAWVPLPPLEIPHE